jgi:hypothetical protein
MRYASRGKPPVTNANKQLDEALQTDDLGVPVDQRRERFLFRLPIGPGVVHIGNDGPSIDFRYLVVDSA